MQFIIDIFNTIFATPILNLLVAFYKLFLSISLPGAFGFAIIALTVLIRVVLHPFFKQQLESSKKMQELKPHLDKLSQKHKKDPQKLQQEQMLLYKQAGINPAAGCLFMLIQLPVFIALYNTLQLFLNGANAGHVITTINKALYSPLLKIGAIDPYFFGLNLAISPAKGGHIAYYAIPIVTALLQYLQAQATAPMMQQEAVTDKTLAKDGKTPEKKDTSADFQKALNMQMKYFFPLMIGWFSWSLPIGLALYWNIFSIFSIVQYKKLKK